MKNKIIKLLTDQNISKIYSNTYYSLVDRIDDFGYLQESITGLYDGEFCRTIGAYARLMAVTGRIDLAKRSIRFIMDIVKLHKLRKVPHVISNLTLGEKGDFSRRLDMDDQIDGTAHVINAWAELVLDYGAEKLGDDYWTEMVEMLEIHLNQPYFYYVEDSNYSVGQLRLFFNCSFEHSREERRWATFDLLTQCFMGAALEKMIKIAELKEYHSLSDSWKNKLNQLIYGIDQYLTREVDGKKLYLEMRLPDSNWGKPYYGMGWISLSPIAAGWEPLDRVVLKNTVNEMRKRLWKEDYLNKNLHYLAAEYDENDNISDYIIGKSIGWDIEYSKQEGDYNHILQWLEFLEENHRQPVFSETMRVDNGIWTLGDCGNGEQCSWWCLGIALLRKDLGLDPAPMRNNTDKK